VPRLSELTRRQALEPLVAEIVALELPARIAIDGPDAAGKTMLAGELEAMVAGSGRSVSRLSADDFLRPRQERYRQGRDSPEGYYADSFDHAALAAAVERGEGIVLVDGIFLQRPELAGLWSFRVFVAVSEEESLRRGIERDLALHPSREEAERLYRARYLPGQRLYEAKVAPRDAADAILWNEDPARARLVLREGVRQPGA
jgi:uridine kinase